MLPSLALNYQTSPQLSGCWITCVQHCVCARVHVLMHVQVCVPTHACTESKRGNQVPCSILLSSLGLILSLNLELGWRPACPQEPSYFCPFHSSEVTGILHVRVGARDLNSDPNGCAANSLIHGAISQPLSCSQLL